MSDKKMIIRNCPAIYGIDDGFLCSYRENEEDEKYCYDCTDCVMKQIVELCRKEQKYHKEWQKETGFNYVTTGLRLAEEILKLLDIQEVE